MPDLSSSRINTRSAARGAYGRHLITKKVLHRLQDGTVSRQDVTQARRLVDEQSAILRSMHRRGRSSPEALRVQQAKTSAAYELSRAVERQYDQQGGLETRLENTKDWWNGSAW